MLRPLPRLPFAALLALAVGGTLVTGPARGEDWPTFRGASRTAVAPDTNLLESWPEGGPKLLWKAVGAGRGYATPAIAGKRIYTLGDGLSTAGDDKDEYLTCYDRESGKQLWKTKTGQAWNEGPESWQSSRSTPTVDGDLVYVITPQGVLIGCQTSDGAEKLRIDLKATFGGKKGDGWGYSESPLVDGDRLIVTPGGDDAMMVALDKKTGKEIWKCPQKDCRGAGHSSIVISKVGNRKVYVQTTASGAVGIDAASGKLLWSYPIDQTTAVIPTPIIRGDLVFFSAGYRRGGALLKQVATADGVKMEEIYGLKQELANKHGGVVLIGDHIYGDSDDQGIPFCAELMTGKIVWKERATGKGSIAVVAADGHVYLRFQDGILALVRADPAGFKEVSTFKIPDSDARPSWAHPVILDGKLYLREQDAILCYDITAK